MIGWWLVMLGGQMEEWVFRYQGHIPSAALRGGEKRERECVRKRMASLESWCMCVALHSFPIPLHLSLSDSFLTCISICVLSLLLDSISISAKMVLCGFFLCLSQSRESPSLRYASIFNSTSETPITQCQLTLVAHTTVT